MTGLRVRAEDGSQTQQDATAHLDSVNTEDPNKKQPQAASYTAQEHENHQPEMPQAIDQHKDQLDDQHLQEHPVHPIPAPAHNEKPSPPTYQQESTTDPQPHPDDVKENPTQLDNQHLQDNQLNPIPPPPGHHEPHPDQTQNLHHPQPPAPPQYPHPPYNHNLAENYQGQGHRSHGLPGNAYTISPCDVHGEFLCNGPHLFGLCNWGEVIWLPVAAGTACRDGGIGYA